MTRTRRGAGAVAAGVCLFVGLGLTGCGSTRNQAAGTPGAGAPAFSTAHASSTAAGSQGGTTSATTSAPSATKLPKLPKGVSTALPKDPVASKITPVKRNGKAVHPHVAARGNDRSFSKPITYTDGLTLKITKMTRGTMTGQGPGTYANRPVTDFNLTLTNDTKKALSLDVVVVTATYGSPARLAHPVYDKKSVDLSGTVKPGGSARAVYGFAVPAADRAHVTMTVDLDGIHQLAVFTGKVS